MIIDIDSHFEPGPEWPDPFPGLKARLPVPHPGISAVDAIVGDLLRHVPESQWPPLDYARMGDPIA
jgi:hypothetical protein